MTDERAKRHHYIPKFLIRNWANSVGTVWVLNKQSRKIFRASSSNVFVESNRFTHQGSFESSKSDKIEKFLAGQESTVAPIINRIIDGVRDNGCPQLSHSEILDCQIFLVSLTRRTPESVAKIFDDESELFFQAVRKFSGSEAFAGDDPKPRDNPTVKKYIELTTGNSVANFATGQHHDHQLEVQKFILESGLECLIVRNSSRGLLLGSLGYVHLHYRTAEKRNHTATYFPVAPDVALAFTACPEWMRITYFEDDAKENSFIRKVNESIKYTSNFVVAKAKCSLMD